MVGEYNKMRWQQFCFFVVLVSKIMLKHHVIETQEYDVCVLTQQPIGHATRVYSATCNWGFPLLRFRSAVHCGYSGITDIQDGIWSKNFSHSA
jgi:hypothetical protein